MCRQILLTGATRREMMKTFKVGPKPLERALKYDSDSSTSRMLRAAALERGGLIYNDAGWSKGFSPKCDTHHDHATGTIRQEFGDGLEVRIDRAVAGGDFTAVVVLKGEPIATFPEFTAAKWGRVVYGVQMIYNTLNS